MSQHSKSYEQYCCVMKKNVIMEETNYHDGRKSLRCVNHVICAMNGGCKNKILHESIARKETV